MTDEFEVTEHFGNSKENGDSYYVEEDNDESEGYEDEKYTDEKSNKELNENDGIGFCLHHNSESNNGVQICSDCGIEICTELSLDPEWRYYGDNDSKHASDPSRCYLRKQEDKNIFKDIEVYEFPTDINNEINSRYMEITKIDEEVDDKGVRSKGGNKIHRGTFRRSLLFACAHNVFKQRDNVRGVVTYDMEKLREKMKLTRKDASKGLTFYNLNKKTREKPIYISPAALIPIVLKKFNAKPHHIDNVNKLFDQINNRSCMLNRSNPQSVISGLIYYYFRSKSADITCNKFSEIIKLSDITISKISKEISDILGTSSIVSLN